MLTVSCVLISWESIREREAGVLRVRCWLLETGLIGVFCAFDLMLFYVFFEFTLIPLFFLIGIWGGPQRRYAAIKFFLYTLAGSLVTLVGLVALVLLRGRRRAGDAVLDSRVWRRWLAANPLSPETAGRAVPGALGGVHGQGAGVSAPHVVAAGARRSADGRQRAAGRRAAEARHVRLPAAVPAAVSRRLPDGRPAAVGGAGGRRHHLRLALRAGAARHQEARRLQQRRPPGLLHAGAVRAERRRAFPAACCR